MEKIKISIEDAKNTSIDELLQKFSSSPQGLSSSESNKRIETYGYNEIIEKKASPLVKFFSYFWGTYSVDDRSSCYSFGNY